MAGRVSLCGMTTTNKGVFALTSTSSIPSWLEGLLICPACGADVEGSARSFRCTVCVSEYPVCYGIPDFRLWPDPYITVEEELVKIRKLLTPAGRSFRELLAEYYYVLSPGNHELYAHFITAMEGSVARGAALLRKLRAGSPGHGDRRLLDVGCGTAGLALAASREFREVVGVDVALRYLLIGRQRMNEAKVDVPLICANAEALPFREGVFDAVVADAVLEHVRESTRMRDETIRVLAPGGAFCFTTNNRFSVLPEPHVRILGFGLLPRRWMEAVALRVRNTPYKARLHSRRELHRVFHGVGRVDLPAYEPGELGERNERARRVWDVLRRIPPIRWLLTPVVPQYFISGRKPGT